MGENTKIAWCDHTFNPWWGCTKVSDGCANCYAEGVASRFAPGLWGPSGRRRFFGDKHWAEPVKWNRKAERDGVRRKVFCGSMCDVFEVHHSSHPDQLRQQAEWLRLGKLIDDTPHLDWLLLTKRPEHIGRFMWGALIPDNIWLGTTAENQEQTDKRLPELLRWRKNTLFVSCEPLLGPVSIEVGAGNFPDWVITGAESGRRARTMYEDWVRALRDECNAAGVPFFYKQRLDDGRKVEMPELDGRMWGEFPR